MTNEVLSQSQFGLTIHYSMYLNISHSFHRQLEAIIRISESLAKITLSPVVKNHHVDEAIRLFKFSTMDAVSAGSADGLSRGELNDEMNKIDKELRRRLPIGWSTSFQSLVREFVTQQGYSSHALERTLFVLEKREFIRFSGQVRLPYPARSTGTNHLTPAEKGRSKVWRNSCSLLKGLQMFTYISF